MIRRTSIPACRWHVVVARHLPGHRQFHLADALLADLRLGRSPDRHLSPMKQQKAAFKRAHRRENWTDYRRFMDHLLNKWGFYHFHCAGGSMLVFVHFSPLTGIARVLELVRHDDNWCIERHLVEIAVGNWPDGNIAWRFGHGSSRLTEEDLFKARKQGLNMVVHVDGNYYIPARRALMSDGSGYIPGILAPIAVFALRYQPEGDRAPAITSPHSLVLGLDPDDPRSPWEAAAEHAGMLTNPVWDQRLADQASQDFPRQLLNPHN